MSIKKWLYDKCWGVHGKQIFPMTINDFINIHFGTFFSIRAGASGTRVSKNPIHMKILHLQKVNSKPITLCVWNMCEITSWDSVKSLATAGQKMWWLIQLFDQREFCNSHPYIISGRSCLVFSRISRTVVEHIFQIQSAWFLKHTFLQVTFMWIGIQETLSSLTLLW